MGGVCRDLGGHARLLRRHLRAARAGRGDRRVARPPVRDGGRPQGGDHHLGCRAARRCGGSVRVLHRCSPHRCRAWCVRPTPRGRGAATPPPGAPRLHASCIRLQRRVRDQRERAGDGCQHRQPSARDRLPRQRCAGAVVGPPGSGLPRARERSPHGGDHHCSSSGRSDRRRRPAGHGPRPLALPLAALRANPHQHGRVAARPPIRRPDRVPEPVAPQPRPAADGSGALGDLSSCRGIRRSR